MYLKKAVIMLSGILNVALMSPVNGTTTLGLPPSTVKLEIVRVSHRNGIIYGSLRLQDGNSVFNFQTRENEQYVIPEGSYPTALEWSNKRHRLVPFLQVPKRSDIEIHPSGNALYLRGCIGVSQDDFETLINLLPSHASFLVVVSDVS